MDAFEIGECTFSKKIGREITQSTDVVCANPGINMLQFFSLIVVGKASTLMIYGMSLC